MATGRASRNLDGWMLGRPPTGPSLRASADADLSIVEGMMGLFDGSSPIHELGSTAELAKQLNAPVLLVIDGNAMARSAAAMASGYASFDPGLKVMGVLFNRVRSEGHYRLLREAVEAETDLMVVGYLRPDESVTIQDRHLGLRTAIEQGAGDLYDRLGRSATDTIDVERVVALARSAGAVGRRSSFGEAGGSAAIGSCRRGVRCGVLFYYQDNLDLLETAGPKP